MLDIKVLLPLPTVVYGCSPGWRLVLNRMYGASIVFVARIIRSNHGFTRMDTDLGGLRLGAHDA
jgi:hypothetical protein